MNMENINTKKISATLLKEFYSRVINIFEAINSGLVLYTDENLNNFYKLLTDIINSMLEESQYSKLRKFAPEFYENITGKINVIDQEWDQYKEELYNFSSKLESYCLELGAKKEMLNENLWNIFFNNIDEGVLAHRKTVKYFSTKLRNSLDEERVKIYISDNRGIWRKHYKTILIYEIGLNTKRFNIIKSLKTGQISGPNLATLYSNNNLSQISKEINKINSLFKEKLSLNEGLINKASTGGYQLNNTYFDINFE